MRLFSPDLPGASGPLGEPGRVDAAPVSAAAAGAAGALPPRPGSRRLDKAVAATAPHLLPLVKLLDSIQPHLARESVFRTRRQHIQAHLALAYAELKTERPKRKVLAAAFKALAELVREESRDISPDELKQAAREVVLATLKNAPALLNAAHQARLLS